MRSVLGPLVVALLLLTTACSGDEGAAPRSDLPTESPPRWNPCDGLDHQAVAAAFETRFTVLTGSDDAPQCTFTPAEDGAPAVDVNYDLFPGTLTELMSTFGEVESGAATRVNGPGFVEADDARIIVDVRDGTLAVTGFVQNGGLVQVVNALDPKPFDRRLLRLGVRTMLADLAAHAAESGLS